jgi:hypothetical protein
MSWTSGTSSQAPLQGHFPRRAGKIPALMQKTPWMAAVPELSAGGKPLSAASIDSVMLRLKSFLAIWPRCDPADMMLLR